jgi:hypothetical protein
MSKNEHIDPSAPHGVEEGAPLEPQREERGDDHELFAEESLNALPEPAEAPLAAPEPEPAIAAPPRKGGGLIRKLFVSTATVALLLGGVGAAAVAFKDKDERLRAISDMIDDAARDPRAFAIGADAKFSALIKKLLGQEEAEPVRVASLKSDLKTAEAQKAPAAEKAAPEPPAPARAAPGWAAPQDIKPVPGPKTERAAPPATPPSTPATPYVSGPGAEAQAQDAQTHGLLKRIEQLETAVREAAETARAAQESASKPATGKSSTEIDAAGYYAALEGRIDELAGEIKELRERLDQPKAETRVAPEAAEAAAPAPAKNAVGVEVLSLAHSLQQSFERGRPYSAQLSALAERGVDPQLLTPLSPYAEKGAPTATHLLAEFKGVAQRLRVEESHPAPSGSLAGQLLHDAEKLVRVRPVGEAQVAAAVNEILQKVESALARGDFDAASEGLAKLPEKERAETQDFAEALNKRRDAEEAVASLVAGAVAGLGHNKN